MPKTVIHKRKFLAMAYSLCGFWRYQSWDKWSKFCDWNETRWSWKYVTCKKCLKFRNQEATKV